ncbi:toll/interleukin-1 receptor domain-containing protein [Algoriphagus aestuariicola]|uniref:Toll/interleukin-1 receptor domain-containing protein n=1 Tax=Algoriphagus aestuariicola TaxID=1852016 RepID=A0ABS3BNB4_9BACT|nr:toll/interleukin-1 receptor domain-containing protein [Algoriphagus aestuariicola]MBN7800540.1 toll/interleukin-1 receptor domain-containing protein [Algoriphagus aestuariicola]
MTTNRKIELLQKILNKTEKIKVESSSDPDFKTWKSLTERTLIKVFGAESHEIREFEKLYFFYNPGIWVGGMDYSVKDLREFRKDLKIAKDLIINYIDEFKEDLNGEDEPSNETKGISSVNKVFISHSSKDSEIVEELIDILETIGLDSTSIFCTSFGEYGISFGENFLQRIKNELTEKTLVLFLISENFYSSPVCLCEMGATWVQSKEHIPILIPPFRFDQIEGVIPLTQGLYINDCIGLNLLKDLLEEKFIIEDKIKFANWERKRDRILKRLDEKIN